eukprot:GCRY01003393.1.p1 GENE.GCRY01003393.1~~GCRY01003393.1.p1  ORF type:complete len:623 (-),score=148.18 GCRY01003393.1:29-1897(-)
MVNDSVPEVDAATFANITLTPPTPTTPPTPIHIIPSPRGTARSPTTPRVMSIAPPPNHSRAAIQQIQPISAKNDGSKSPTSPAETATPTIKPIAPTPTRSKPPVELMTSYLPSNSSETINPSLRGSIVELNTISNVQKPAHEVSFAKSTKPSSETALQRDSSGRLSPGLSINIPASASREMLLRSTSSTSSLAGTSTESLNTLAMKQIKDLVVPSGPKAGKVGSSFNLANYIIGAGILALPLTFSWTGLVLQSVLLFVMGLFSAYTARMIIFCGIETGASTYQGCVRKLLGQKASTSLSLLIAIGNFGSLCAYLILIGDFATSIAEHTIGHSNRRMLIIGTGCLLCYPLCLLKNLNSLRFTSLMSMTFILFTVITVITDSADFSLSNGFAETPSMVNINWKLFRAIPISVFAYQCHIILFPVQKEMKDRSQRGVNKVINSSFTFCFLMYLLMGVFGYLRFYHSDVDLGGNVLNSYGDSDDVASPDLFVLIEGLFFFIIVFSYPMVNFSCRLATQAILFKDSTYQPLRTWVIVTCLVGSSLLVAISVEDVSIVFGLIGSIASPALTMVFPAACLLALTRQSQVPWNKNLGEGRVGAFFTLGFAGFVCVTGVLFNILSLIGASP